MGEASTATAVNECSELKIDEEFRDLCPALRESEYAALEQSILQEGCRESLCTWKGTIVDGHHRYQICRKHSITFRVTQMNFSSRRKAKWWIISNQIARRNLTLIQASYLRGSYWSIAKTNDRRGVNTKGGEKILPEGARTQQDAVGKLFGVSGSTIRNDYDVFIAVNQLCARARSHVLSGSELVRKQYVIELSSLSEEAQIALIAAVERDDTVNIGSLLTSLRGRTRKGKGLCRKCPTCGARLAEGVTTCLKCDLDQKAIVAAASPVSDDDSDLCLEGIHERLARVREAKQAEEGATLNDAVEFHSTKLLGLLNASSDDAAFEKNDANDAVEFHAGRLSRLLSTDEAFWLEHRAVKILRKLGTRLSQIVDFAANRPKLKGESAWKLADRSRR